ncbi:hypothetical protein BKD30_01080 [Tersicoccus phoenicis]|uniref:RES domain-containing protein n=1 Tax=Tersicoccus phoenicis TaxID=554083 RepID=A0A1R1LP85_9MICC|nr:hypothetical protein BKD30_01080 [Tersicoccus phoenicis]
MRRDQTSFQDEPDPGLDLSAFPTVECASEVVYRAHSIERDPRWFSSDGGGRFDLPVPRGTLYAAGNVKTATRERLAKMLDHGRKVLLKHAQAFAVSTLVLPPAAHFADLNDPTADEFGATNELAAMRPYAVPQAWARAFDDAGINGVRYGARSTSLPANSWALFGAAGADDTLPVPELQAIDGVAACALSGVDVVSPGEKSGYDLVQAER